jgi:aryl-alcohol dehydrogenase-like predicted oxidoreductase
MRYVEVGGVRVSAIGLGTWQFGSMEWGYGDRFATEEAGRIVTRALDLGINLVDTAEAYAFGRSERIIGEAIRDRRDDVFVATKVFPVLPLAPIVEQRAKRSAQRLGVDAIDLYQVHWPNPVVPDRPAMDGLRHLLDQGVIRHAGVSNYSLRRWQSAEQFLGRPLLSNQVEYSLVQRKPERELLPWAQREGRIVIAYSPLAKGLLSAKYDAEHRPKGRVRQVHPHFLPENLDRAAGLLGALREIASDHDATPSQVALAWLIRRPNVVAIPGASSVEQLEANAAAADLDLTDEDDTRLTKEAESFIPVGAVEGIANLVKSRLGK